MFGFFKNKNEHKNDFETIQEIIRDFGVCMENFPEAGIVIYDEDLLPYSKTEIRDALIEGYKLTNNETLKVAMENLGWFQKNIGEFPLRGAPNYAEMSPEQIVNSVKNSDEDTNVNLKKFEKMSILAAKEYKDILKLL